MKYLKYFYLFFFILLAFNVLSADSTNNFSLSTFTVSSNATERGLLIKPQIDMFITNITVQAPATPSFCRFHKINQSSYANISIISQSTFTGNVLNGLECVFPSPVEAHANTSYIIMIGTDVASTWGEKYTSQPNNNGTFNQMFQQFVFFRDFGRDFGLGSFDIRTVAYQSPTCTELWIPFNTSCNGVNTTLLYYDFFNCNSTFTLPLNNGTVTPCSLAQACADQLCLDPIYANETCCITTPTTYCNDYTYRLFDNNGVNIENGNMTQFNPSLNTFFYYFTQDVGTYYTKICDDSTRQLNVVAREQMLSVFDWTLIILFIMTVVTMILGIWINPIFFGGTALMFAFIGGTLFFSGYPALLTGACGIMVLFFTILAYFTFSQKR